MRLDLRPITRLVLLVVAFWGGPTAAALDAQAPPARTEFCFYPRSLPACQWFLITEAGYAVPLARTAPPDGVPTTARSNPNGALALELGIMRNLTARWAAGATLSFLDLDADESRAAIRARLRRWLSPAVTAELAPGLIVEANDVLSDYPFAPALPGWSLQANLGYRDIALITAQVDVVRAGPETVADLLAGVRAGSGAGAAGLIALGVITVIGILTL